MKDMLIFLQDFLMQVTGSYMVAPCVDISVVDRLIQMYMYSAVSLKRGRFPQNPHNRHTIAPPCGRTMGCLLWF